ncbi:NAD-dependent epimerase/dehydratase family protein [Bradyrhizobium sp. CB3481]|uniref:NAD-dependent epimerase/dehydratase family protein n=1 Tax=Bradyrhizobium sp. CB3481 TaxID=3039158 RepID=UPI0024B0E29A|nr:NAD-dependent epimerase/dehydratase family protein [Bradyrhizobium sp. CB3481]WFU14583.1 NAD-dependent epimerase/dehydratase family protein [Bradyrhizobium sp. CB3481]
MRKIIITGAAGLVGQNLVARLKSRNDLELVGIDKHKANIRLFRETHLNVPIIEADLALPGSWIDSFADGDTVVINQAQIGGRRYQDFEANNVTATRNVLAAMRVHSVPYFVGVSSSVVNSKADDFYTRSKKAQEGLYVASDLPHVILRPTLMFGWFDRKHLGWLRHFMDRTPIFPIPGSGKFTRQPLYVGDFVSVIIAAIEHRKTGTFDISGLDKIFYRDLIVMIHEIVKPRSRIIQIPYTFFWALLWLYEKINRNPPFTTTQLEALVIPETFPVIDWPKEFGARATPLERALTETYLDPAYSSITLAF